jgi:molybdopterin-guanine dinucleotide biosynthesis protein
MVQDRVDIVLTEGYRGASAQKIELSRHAHGAALTAPLDDLIAIITDHPYDLAVPQYALDDAHGVADLLQGRFALRRRQALCRS